MIGRPRHLDDERLHECYLAERSGGPLDPRAVEHLADCAACGARYAEVAGFLAGVRHEGELEADEVFTAERLDQQQAQILRRIEQLNRSARVISFPGFGGSAVASASRRVAPRWLAAAAAAGLFVGVAVGGMVSGQRAARNSATLPIAAPPAVLVSAAPDSVEPIDDISFLLELELALERPRTQELQPIDAWTPRIREITAQLR